MRVVRSVSFSKVLLPLSSVNYRDALCPNRLWIPPLRIRQLPKQEAAKRAVKAAPLSK
jgi:hypothetical protein